MRLKYVATLIVGIILAAFLLQACGGLDLERTEHQSYYLRIQEDGQVSEGHMIIDTAPVGDDKLEIKIDFKLGDSSFTQTMTPNIDEIEDAFGTLMFTNPVMLGFYGPLFASQAMLFPLMMTGGQISEGFQWETTQDGETMTYRVTDSETRFGMKAYWMEVLIDHELVVKMLLTEDDFIPFVVEIKDPEILEEGQQGLYYELVDLRMRD